MYLNVRLARSIPTRSLQVYDCDLRKKLKQWTGKSERRSHHVCDIVLCDAIVYCLYQDQDMGVSVVSLIFKLIW